MAVAYNPNDPTQQNFLSALALGESGNASNALTLGFGGSDLSGDPADQFGFPQWAGEGNSHAAGLFQFQPSTWDSVASQYNLNFSNPQDQSAGAWYVAQQAYSNATGGDLSTALSQGNYGSVQSALASIWPSVAGNAAAPQGLAANLASGTGAAIPGASAAAAPASAPVTIFTSIENWFERGGLIIIGGLVIIAALWALLSNAGYVPTPKSLVKGALA